MNEQIQFQKLPLCSKIALYGILLSFLLRGIFGLAFELVKEVVPQFRPLDQLWFVPLLIFIWLPAVVALICGYFVIIRYPYLSQAIELQDPIIQDRKSPIWKLLGVSVIAAGFLMGLGSIGAETISLLGAMIYISITMMFSGFLLGFFDRKRNIVIATFLDTTLRFGIVLVPLYIPALFLGAIVNSRFQKSISDQFQE